MRVLVVDDQENFRRTLQLILDLDERITVVGVAGDGDEAVRLAGELEPDVVLMDIAMPVVDGFEATRRILAARPQTRVLMLTGSSLNVDLQLAHDVGAAGYVTKSRIDTLADTILALSEADL